jgi:hypothetical protein
VGKPKGLQIISQNGVGCAVRKSLRTRHEPWQSLCDGRGKYFAMLQDFLFQAESPNRKFVRTTADPSALPQDDNREEGGVR